MQDYAKLYQKEYRKKRCSDKEQLKIIKQFLGSGKTPMQILACIMIFIASVRR